MNNHGQGYNRLKDEKSLYLQQHAKNPVHWWPWGPEAHLKSKEDNKPILLSIGYSSCHWCHVMAHESFEDTTIAKILNDHFICIKVDKEEYPDLDSYYQTSCQIFTQTGGWPLNAFLLPDLKPFFVGTYFSNKKINEAPTFSELLNQFIEAYKNDHGALVTNAQKVTQMIEDGPEAPKKIDFPGDFPPPMAVIDAVKDFRDLENGGFGTSPKFFNFTFFEWAVEQILEGMIEKDEGKFIIDSIEKLLMGGITDQIKGGIHRYATDEKWLIPHFEKMLYDQSGLLKVLSKVSLVYPSPLVYDCLMDTLLYLESEMLSDKNYFFSAQDADSEGVEGLYFTYTLEELEDSLKSDESIDTEKIKKWFGIKEDGNFHSQLNILSLNHKDKEEFYQSNEWDMIRKAKQCLLQERKKRIPPSTDNKGVASWNFLLLSSLCDVVQYCQIDVIKKKAFDLIHSSVEGMYQTFVVSKDQSKMKINHSTTLNNGHLYFEDYVFFSEAQLRVYEVTGNPVFKANFLDSFQFIQSEFIKDSKIFTRSLTDNTAEEYPNQNLFFFDGSFKSPASTFYSLLRRAQVLFPDEDFKTIKRKFEEEIKQQALNNPLSSGEALRTLTYPDHAYRVLKIPQKWARNNEFIKFISFFLPRFILDYQLDEKSEAWQVCSMTSCELKGSGLLEFKKALSGKNE